MAEENWNRKKVKQLVATIVKKAENKAKISVGYKNWRKIFAPATSLNLNLVYDGIKLTTGYLADKDFVPNLFRNGLLSELSEITLEKASKVTKLLTSLPYVERILVNYGMDELALNRAIYILEDNKVIADKIGSSIADIIQNQDPKNKADLLTKLVDNIIDAAAQSETSHITTAKFIHEFLKKFCSHKLPQNYQLVVEAERVINHPEANDLEKEFFTQKKIDLTSNYTMMDMLSYNFRDYQNLVADLNERQFLVSLTESDSTNIAILKNLNSRFMQFVHNSRTPQEGIENQKAFVIEAVDLATEQKAGEKLTPLFTTELLKKIFDLPSAIAIAEYKTLTLNLASDVRKFQDAVGAILSENEKFRSAIKNLLDFSYMPKNDAKLTDKAFEKSILSFIDLASSEKVITKLIPLFNEQFIDDLFAIVSKDRALQPTKNDQQSINFIAIAQEVLKNEAIRGEIGEVELSMLEPLLANVNDAKSPTNNSPSTERFTNKMIASLLRNLPSKEVLIAVNANQKGLAEVINELSKKSSSLADVFAKCELDGVKIVEFLPKICNKASLNALANCIESPNAANITNLLLTDVKIIPFVVTKLVAFCKNSLKDAIYKTSPEVDLKVMQGKVEQLTPKGFKQRTHYKAPSESTNTAKNKIHHLVKQ